MATIKHARTVALQATSPRINAINLPPNVTADWATQVTGTAKPADYATVNRVQRGASFTGTPIDGDIWIDTSVTPNLIKTRVGGAWQIGANYSTNTNQLTDGAGLGTTSTWGGVSGTGKPADDATKNIVTASGTAPSSPTNGDIWVDTSGTPYLLKVRVAGAWTTGARNTTDTNQLTDSAGLGTTATWASVTGTGKPSNNADVTATILGASGTSIVMTNANLFKSSSGTAGVFIGSGGLIGKNSSGATTFSIDGSTGNATFYGALSGATGTFAGELSAATGTFAGTLSAACVTSGTMNAARINGGTLSGTSIQIADSGSGWLLNAGYAGTVVYYRRLEGYNIYAGNNAAPGSSPVIGDSGTAAAGVYGTSSGSGGHGVRGEAGNGLGFVGYNGGTYDFYASGSATNYGPFTGAHDALVPKGAALEVGDIVVDVGVAVRKNVSNTICEVEPSTAAAQGAAVGVVCTLPTTLEMANELPAAMMDRMWTTQPDGQRVENLIPCREWYDLRLTHDKLTINALGEGQLNVCGLGGNLQPGDLITTSALPGKGQRQADDVVRASSVAKCREAVTFDFPGQVKQVACIYLCG
jgi:hypothetical protein